MRASRSVPWRAARSAWRTPGSTAWCSMPGRPTGSPCGRVRCPAARCRCMWRWRVTTASRWRTPNCPWPANRGRNTRRRCPFPSRRPRTMSRRMGGRGESSRRRARCGCCSGMPAWWTWISSPASRRPPTKGWSIAAPIWSARSTSCIRGSCGSPAAASPMVWDWTTCIDGSARLVRSNIALTTSTSGATIRASASASTNTSAFARRLGPSRCRCCPPA